MCSIFYTIIYLPWNGIWISSLWKTTFILHDQYNGCWGPGNLTHWGRVTHICVGKLTILGSDNGLSPGRRQAIIWTNAAISLIGPFGTNCREILIGIQTFSFKEMRLIMSSAKWRPFCLGLNELRSQKANSHDIGIALFGIFLSQPLKDELIVA